MPEVSRFFGISIRMWYDEHNPPHFHAIYAESEAQIGITPISLLEGQLPRRALGLVDEWAAERQRQLSENWDLMRNDQAPNWIEPLDEELPIMSPRVTDVRHLGDFRLEILFSDGVSGVLDFAPRILNRHGVFEPLHDSEFFRQVRVDPVSGTLCWPNNVDLCPDQLYRDVLQAQAPNQLVDAS